MKSLVCWLLIFGFFYPLIVTSVLADPPQINGHRTRRPPINGHRFLPKPAINGHRLMVPQADITLTLTSTSRQIIAKYTAPSTSPCTVEVSESNTYSPLVPDVNTTLFSGSDQDNRTGGLGAGTTSRTFIAGTIQQPNGTVPVTAGDTKNYARSLQVNTTHYVRVTCGSHTGTGSIATKNPPLGKTWAEPVPITAAGAYGFPTIDATSRTQTTLDPQTGYKLVKMSITDDNNALSGTDSAEFTESGSEWIWSQTTVDDNAGNHYYLAQFNTLQGFTRIYSFNTANGTAHFLGHLAMPGGTLTGFSTTHYPGFVSANFNTGDATKTYSIINDDTGDSHVIRCALPASGNVYYATDRGAGLNASCTWTDLTASPTLAAQMLTFDAAFDKTKFAGYGNQWVQGHYLMFAANRGQQNSYAWVGAFDLNTNMVVALFPAYSRASTLSGNWRFCGYHTPQANLGSNLMSWESHDLVDSSGAGEGPYSTTLTASMDATQLTMQLASNTPSSPFADTTLYAFQAGDEVRIDENEIVILGAFISGTTWNILARGGQGFTAHTHSNGAPVRAGCRAHDQTDFTQASIASWDFINDPHGNDITGVFLSQINDGVNGHQGWANGRKIGSGWKGCAISDVLPCAPTLTFSNSPSFNGVTKNAGGNAWMMHAAPPHQSLASTAEKVWGMDFNLPYTDPDMSGYTLTNVTGTLFKYVNSGYTFDFKSLPIAGFVGTHRLLDISSATTGNQIVGTSGDNYKMCLVYKVNECRTGSALGEIYINAPSITTGSTCPVQLTGTSADDDKLCVFNVPAVGQDLQQIGIIANNSTFKYIRSLTQGLAPYKLVSTVNNGQATPDGLWAAWANDQLDGKRNVWLVKLPPFPSYDSIDRNTFMQTPITVGAVGGATEALIEFGYDTNLYPTSRAEVGVSAASNAPYFFASETFTAVSCSSGCTINIPVVPDHVAFYRIKWRDSGHSVVSTSAMQATVDSGSGGSPPPPTVQGTTINGIRISGMVMQ